MACGRRTTPRRTSERPGPACTPSARWQREWRMSASTTTTRRESWAKEIPRLMVVGGLALAWLAAGHEERAWRTLRIEREHAGPDAAVRLGRRGCPEQRSRASARQRAAVRGHPGQARHAQHAVGMRARRRNVEHGGGSAAAPRAVVVRHDAERRQLEIVAHVVRRLERAVDVLQREARAPARVRRRRAAPKARLKGRVRLRRARSGRSAGSTTVAFESCTPFTTSVSCRRWSRVAWSVRVVLTA